jgi:hypothetical protein
MLVLIALTFFPIVQSFILNGGITKPLGFFDPLGLSIERSDSQLLWLREAELKHGRWSMIAATAIPLTESMNNAPAIHSLDNTNTATQVAFMTIVIASEFQLMLNGWYTPFNHTNQFFTLTPDYNPGDFKFAIPKMFASKDESFMVDAELNHARLAMIGSLGMIVQELVTNKPLF